MHAVKHSKDLWCCGPVFVYRKPQQYIDKLNWYLLASKKLKRRSSRGLSTRYWSRINGQRNTNSILFSFLKKKKAFFITVKSLARGMNTSAGWEWTRRQFYATHLPKCSLLIRCQKVEAVSKNRLIVTLHRWKKQWCRTAGVPTPACLHPVLFSFLYVFSASWGSNLCCSWWWRNHIK